MKSIIATLSNLHDVLQWCSYERERYEYGEDIHTTSTHVHHEHRHEDVRES